MADPKVEERPANADASDSESDAPELEAAAPQGEGGDEQVPKGRQTRSEKKSRKAMAKLGLKPVAGCKRVTIRKNKSVVFVIAQPDVYKSPQANTYVVFGEAKMEDEVSRQQQATVSALAEATKPKTEAAPQPEEDGEDEEEVDAEGVESSDIDIVMSQTSASRAKVIKALRNTNNDVVNAIMELTS
eukprot:TRINITY_DN529_c0_g1_i2.p2 TRINITY_DN529_c0_g1~~TRINITY_DN529_c0_g1_i2.p2  ORF type:complete len:187 (+),score=78.59 TRINITY_DN529_c0_g1_i2:61-621(+)